MTIGFVGGFITSYLLLSVLSSFLFLTLLFSLLVISLTLLLQKKSFYLGAGGLAGEKIAIISKILVLSFLLLFPPSRFFPFPFVLFPASFASVFFGSYFYLFSFLSPPCTLSVCSTALTLPQDLSSFLTSPVRFFLVCPLIFRQHCCVATVGTAVVVAGVVLAVVKVETEVQVMVAVIVEVVVLVFLLFLLFILASSSS